MTTATGVRIVEATRGHIPFVAWVVMAANRSHLPKGMWDFSIGGTEEEVLRYLEVLADTEQAHWGALLAVQGGGGRSGAGGGHVRLLRERARAGVDDGRGGRGQPEDRPEIGRAHV